MADAALPQFKVCRKCGSEKPIADFCRNKNSRHGYENRCRRCAADNTTRHRLKDVERVNARQREMYYAGGREKRAEWRKANPEKVRLYKERHHKKHRAKIVARVKEWRTKNPERRLAQAREEQRKKRATPRGRIDGAMAGGIGSALRGNKAGRAWESLVGYTLSDLVEHLESQFSAGMNWGNYGRGGWHIDHIIPKSVFNYELAEHADFKRCWALSNLQPLWEKQNLTKYNKLAVPFQPSLAL